MNIEVVTNPQGKQLVNLEPFRKAENMDRATLERILGGEVFYSNKDKMGNWWIDKNGAAMFFRTMGWKMPNNL